MPIIGNAGPLSKIYEKNHATDTLNIVVDDTQFSPYQGGATYTLTTTLQEIVENGNTTPETIEFENEFGFVTFGNVGILNTAPIHTLDLGSNLYLDEFGSNVVFATGNIYTNHLKGDDATVDNNVTTKNLIANEDVRCKDVYTNNVQSRTNQHIYIKSNLGVMNNQPTHELSVQDKLFIESGSSNVVYCTGNIYSAHLKSSNVTSSNIYTTNVMSQENSILIHSNVGILNTEPIHTLDIGSNVRIDEYGSNTFHTSGNIHANRFTGDSVIIAGTVSATQFLVGGNAQTNIAPALQTVAEKTPFSADRTMTLTHPTTGLIVDTNVRALTVYSNVIGQNVYTTGDIKAGPTASPIFYVKSSTSKIGINEIAPAADLHLSGNAYMSSNLIIGDDLIVDTDTLHVDVSSDRVGINKLTPDASLHVVGNAYMSSNLIIGDDLIVDTVNSRVGINKLTPDASLHVVGNAYVSSNLIMGDDLIVDTDTLHVDVSSDRVGINKLTPDASLHVVGNAYVSSDFSHGGLLPSSGTEIDQIQRIDKTLTIGTTWMDTGISGTDLATGSYIVQLFANEQGSHNWSEYYTGFMSWYASSTNSVSEDSSEIVLHAAGHDTGDNHTYLRVQRVANTANPNTLKLQIRKDVAVGSQITYEFRFRRMI